MEVGNKRLRVLLCLGILYSLGLGVSATGGVTASNPVIEAKEGEARDLQCTYSNSLTDARVEWKFVNNDQEISFVFYDGALTAAYKNRATAFHQGIRLNDITRKDNGEYTCEVTAKDSTGSPTYGFDKIQLIVLVPPSVPVAQVPTSVTNNKVAQLSCFEKDSSPPATYTWYKNKIPLPENPKSSPAFQNSSYTVDPKTGVLTFETVQKIDAGDYYCEATNSQGKQTSAAVTMSVDDVNVGGIVAAVIVSILLLIAIVIGLWFAYSRGYFNRKTSKKVIYSQPSETHSDRNFQQKSSFLV